MVVLNPVVAGAAFPGTNGLIAYITTRNSSDTVELVNPEAPGIGTGTTDPANTTQLTDGYSFGQTSQGVDSEPFFSPDGNTVAFSSNRNGNYQIFTIPASDAGHLNSDGSDNAALVSQPASDHSDDDYAPTFSPDDCTIVFNRGNQALYTVNICVGSPTATLLYTPPEGLSQNSTSDGSDSRAVFDPVDKTKLVFIGGDNHVHRLSGIGGSLTDTDLSALTSVGAASDADPDWSPDGTQIVFDSTRSSSNHQLYVMSSSGSTAGPLMGANNGKSDTQPVFSPDGKYVAFTEPGQSQDVADEAVMPVAAGGNGLDKGAGAIVDLTLVGTGVKGPVDDQPDWQPVPGTGPVLPEAPYAVLLPGGALLVLGAGFGLRRRRQRRPAVVAA